MAANLEITVDGHLAAVVLASMAYIEQVGDVATGKTLIKFKDSESRSDLMANEDYTTVKAALDAA